MLKRNTFIINHYPEDKYPWYVQQIQYMDYGRFTNKEAAEEHLKFCSKEFDESSL